MQDVQNIPNPDVDSFENEDDFGSHSDVHPDSPISDNVPDSNNEITHEEIPVPPDSRQNVPIEEPPEERDKPAINENTNEPQRLV